MDDIEKMKARHGGSADHAIAWMLGYIESLEDRLNIIAETRGAKRKTLAERLKEDGWK